VFQASTVPLVDPEVVTTSEVNHQLYSSFISSCLESAVELFNNVSAAPNRKSLPATERSEECRAMFDENLLQSSDILFRVRSDLNNFEDTSEAPGSFQVPMLLLALVTGASPFAVKSFPNLQRKITTEIDDSGKQY